MRGMAAGLFAVACLVAACDDGPENQFAAACLNAVRDDNAAWVFGANATGVAEAFCSCVGEGTTQSKRLDPTDKQTILAYLDGFDSDQNVAAIVADHRRFRSKMGRKYPVFSTVVDQCKRRLTK